MQKTYHSVTNDTPLTRCFSVVTDTWEMSPVTAYDLPLRERIDWLWNQVRQNVNRAAAALDRDPCETLSALLPTNEETTDMELGFAVKNLMEIVKLTAGMKGPRD